MTGRRRQRDGNEISNEYREMFTRFFEESPFAITIVDKDGIIQDANQEFVSLVGYRKEEVVGEHFLKFVEEKDVARINEYHMKRIEGIEAPKFYEYRLKRKDGGIRDIEMKVITLLGGRILSCRVDVTEKKRLERELKESEELFRTLAERSLVGVYLIQDGVFKYINPKLAELWGYEVDELIGRSPLEFIHPEYRGTG